MKIMILAVSLVFLLSGVQALAQDDVSIDEFGSITSGTSNASANLEVIGSSGEDGIAGQAIGTGAAGVYGANTTGPNTNFGLLGDDQYGVYGESASGFAGWFQGNARVTGNLTLDGNIVSTIDIAAGSTIGGLTLSTGAHTVDTTLDEATVETFITNGAINLAAGSTIGGTTVSTGPHTADTTLSEATVESYITNSAIDLAAGSTVSGAAVSTGPHTVDTTLNEATVETYVTNGAIDLDPGTTIGGAVISSSGHNHDGVYQNKFGRTAVVAKTGGDYITPVTAMNDIATWCGTPTAATPCLLKIMPGAYSVSPGSLQMVSYVDIEGSGENVTKITGSLDSIIAGVVIGADNAEIRFLTVENTSTGTDVAAIYNSSVSPQITNVTAIVTAGAVVARGIYNDTSNAVLNNVTINVSGSQFANGMENSSSTPIVNNVTISASAPIQGAGLLNYFSSNVAITNSRVNGSFASISTDATTIVANSQLIGTISAPPGTVTCAGAYNASYVFLTSSCQ